jgi:hypothetical protein
MATLDFTHAAFGVDTTEPGFIDYSAVLGTGTPTSWSVVSTAGNRVHVTGGAIAPRRVPTVRTGRGPSAPR